MSANTLANTWEVKPSEARRIQEELRKQVVLSPLEGKCSLIAGADISFNKYEPTVYAGIVVLDIESLQPVAHALAITKVHFPYVPGLLSFREIPALLQAWKLLEVKPDVIMADGHGIAHPRRLGIATHFGLATNMPSLGLAKKKLVGKYEEPDSLPGSFSPLEHNNETVGYVYRTKKNVKPVYVSPGFKTDLESALSILRQTTGKYRIPEPTRQAHLLVNQLRRGEIKEGFYRYPASTQLFS
ncbi:deoxyribonuclease V [Nafulsella turpanensis]|uniref:deoxyribonuclease V n=1 Tax=Nafulsella turpanensis TaxID=1265690 RepID=UPI00034C5DE6|nr:deoxyribonuclease V [Nafulsella turpanensis]